MYALADVLTRHQVWSCHKLKMRCVTIPIILDNIFSVCQPTPQLDVSEDLGGVATYRSGLVNLVVSNVIVQPLSNPSSCGREPRSQRGEYVLSDGAGGCCCLCCGGSSSRLHT